MRAIISRSSRGQFRDLMTSSIVRDIETAFQDEGFAPHPDCIYDDSSIRRVTAQQYLDSVDWTDPSHVARACRVFERLLLSCQTSTGLQRFYDSLIRDGCAVDTDTGFITPPETTGPMRPLPSLAEVVDPSGIQEQIDRIQQAGNDDPALTIGSAKELVESTAKVVLAERGVSTNDNKELPALVHAAQETLGLHPLSAADGPDSSGTVKKILGAATTIATSLGELRNRGYGTGHGAASARVGIRPRHAQLAVNAAVTWCQLMLDTLADRDAPWRQTT